MVEGALLRSLHLIALCVALGGALLFNFVLYPSLKFIGEKKERHRFLAQFIRYYHPFFLGGLSILLLSGAFRVTDLKISLGVGYFSVMGKLLMIKLGMMLLIFNLACMQTMGTGLKFGRMAMGVIPGDEATVDRYARKIWRVSLVNIVCMIGTTFAVFYYR